MPDEIAILDSCSSYRIRLNERATSAAATQAYRHSCYEAIFGNYELNYIID